VVREDLARFRSTQPCPECHGARLRREARHVRVGEGAAGCAIHDVSQMTLQAARDWFAALDMLVLSPKPPSSGEVVDWARFDACLAAAGDAPKGLKIVVFDQTDLDWAREVAGRYPQLALCLQPGNPDSDPAMPVDPGALAQRLDWLVAATLGRGWLRPRILPQLHVLIWGNKRGV
jgi:7-carboxy-7-deazaguanine synthase